MMSRLKTVVVIAAGIAAGLLVVWKLAPDRRSDSQQILDALIDIQQAVRDKSVRGCMKYVSETYADSTVENKRELIRLAQRRFAERGDFYCLLQAERPSVQGQRASVDVGVDFRVDRAGATQRVEPFTVRTDWVKERRGWRIVRAEGYMEAELALDGSRW